ncbi:MAG: hypothetical protein ACHP7E_04855 [Burkholderiales bacterium]
MVGSIPVPGPVRWDYVSVDAETHRLYVAHSDRVDVVDLRSHQPVLQLTPTPGVHGAAIAPDLNRVFTSNGAADALGVFDLQTGRSVQTVKVGRRPDAIVYEPSSRRVFTFNGGSNDVTAVDASTLQVLAAAIPVGGTPEYAVSDGHGHVFFNIEDKGEMAVLDARSLTIVGRYSLAPCEEPSGLAIDPKGRLYSVCRNAVMVVSDPSTGRVIGRAGIGHGADGVAWADGKAWSANGRDGTVSVVEEVSPGEFKTVETVPTARGARTIAADPGLHELLSPTADFPPEAAQGKEPPHRPQAIPGTFRVLVIGRSTSGSGSR